MAQFQYTAVNSAGKKLSGVIGALSEDDARKQLNTFGISILNIDKTAETPVKTATNAPGTSNELPKFEFEAYDKTGQKIVGTIPASSRYKAFKRLLEEYQFEVSFVVPMGSTAEDKEAAKKEGLAVLKAEYESQHGKDEAKEEAAEVSEEFEAKRQALLSRVDFILDKIKKLLASYSQEIKPENKKIIQDYIDKLLRIKSSTNLDYIEHTSEELLKKVQDQELFLHKEKMQIQQDSIALQSKQMMASLHSANVPKNDVIDDIEDIHDRLSESKNPLIKGVVQFIEKYLPTPEEKELKHQIRTVNRQVWNYRKIWLLAPKASKAEAKTSLDAIIAERDKLKQELQVLRANHKGTEQQEVVEPLLTEEITNFLGWLLGFYLVSYFISHYALAKVFQNGDPLPGDFNLLTSPVLQYLLISIFLWYVLLSLRIEYLRYKNWANALILPLGIVINATLIFNL